MPRQRNRMPFMVGLSVWSAVVMLAVAAILYFTDLVSAQQTSTSTLSAPVLTAQAEEGMIELSWTAVTDAARYELWTWNSADGWQRLDDDSLTGTTYRHADLTLGTTYYYWVRAVSDSEETSEWSERQSATVIAPSSTAMTTPTATPTSTPTLTASTLSVPVLTAQAGVGGVDLSWEAVTGAVRYELWRWTSVDLWQQLDDGTLTGTSYSHTDVAEGTTYFYAIRAANTDGETSEWSEYVSLTWTTATATVTPTATPPDQQQNVPATATATATPTATPPDQQQSVPATATATATPTPTPADDQPSQNVPATGDPTIGGTAQVCETLTADVSNIADENGLENVSFSVTWSAGGGYLRKQTVDNFTYVVQTMDLGMTLSVYLHFEDDDGYSEFAESANTAVVVAAASPGKPQRAPSRVRVQTRGSGKLLVSWEGPFSVFCHDGGSPVTGFKVQWKEAADDWGIPEDVSEATGAYDGSPASYTIGGLTDGVEYAVRVIARNAIGDGVASADVSATPQD